MVRTQGQDTSTCVLHQTPLFTPPPPPRPWCHEHDHLLSLLAYHSLVDPVERDWKLSWKNCVVNIQGKLTAMMPAPLSFAICPPFLPASLWAARPLPKVSFSAPVVVFSPAESGDHKLSGWTPTHVYTRFKTIIPVFCLLTSPSIVYLLSFV